MTNEELKAAIEHTAKKCGVPYDKEATIVIEAARELSQLRDGTHPDMVMVPRDTVMNVFKACWSHVDGRNYFTELKPRKTLDILKRIDGKETWHEGDWLTGLGEKLSKLADSVLAAAPKGNAK